MTGLLRALFWTALALVCYSYALYPLVVALLARLFGAKYRRDDDYFPSVAVVVPVFNEEEVVRAKIGNILALDYPADKLSVWIGSDCSTDATHDIVRKLASPRVSLWIAGKRGGKTEVLNHLVPRLTADVILFTDANTMHKTDCLRKMVRSYADPRVGAVAGLIRHRSNNPELGEVMYRSFECGQKYHESLLHSTISAFGGFYSVRRSLFRPLPFNAYSNDDVLIPMNVIRQKHRVVFDTEAVSEEDMTDKIGREFARRIRIGAGNFQAFFWLIDFLDPCRGWPWFCYVSHKVTRWFSPFLLALVLASGFALWLSGAPLIYPLLVSAGVAFIALGMSFIIFPLGITRPMFYFLSMNAALGLGFFRYCAGIKSAAWTRTERDNKKIGPI